VAALTGAGSGTAPQFQCGNNGVCDGALATCNSNLSTCTASSGSCASSLADCNANYASCSGSLGTCNASLTSTQGQLSSCNSSLSNWQAWAASLQSQLNTCNSSLSSTQGQLNSCNSSLASWQAWATSLQSQLTACQAVPIARPLKTGQTGCWDGNGNPIPGCGAGGEDGDYQRGVARGYVDNGNGTITDVATGLMWEKKSYDGSIHDWRIADTWSDALGAAFLGNLNGTCFAGYCDWRLPDSNELQTLVDYGYANPAIYPGFTGNCAPGCTVTTCSCTQAGYYWSSTTYQPETDLAYFVDFGDGAVIPIAKGSGYYVRAVRGGL